MTEDMEALAYQRLLAFAVIASGGSITIPRAVVDAGIPENHGISFDQDEDTLVVKVESFE